MEGHCSTGQNPQWAVVPMEEDVKCPIFLSHFKQIRSFWRNFRESRRFQIFTEICPLGAVRTHGETDGR